MSKIYVVTGVTGEYSDQKEWLVKAFRSRDAAGLLAEKAETRANEIKAYLKVTEIWYWSKAASKVDPVLVNEFDPEMDMDYTGTWYVVQETELVEE